MILSAGGSGGGQHGLGTGDASGLVGVLKGGTYRPDGDIVKIEAIAAPGFQRLDEEMLGCDLEYQRLWGGFGMCGRGVCSGSGASLQDHVRSGRDAYQTNKPMFLNGNRSAQWRA